MVGFALARLVDFGQSATTLQTDLVQISKEGRNEPMPEWMLDIIFGDWKSESDEE